MEMIYCACGCGNQRPKLRSNKPGETRICLYIRGHTNKGKHLTKEHKDHIGIANSGRRMSLTQRRLLSKIRKENFRTGKQIHPWASEGTKTEYIMIWDTKRKKSILAHRYIMEQHLGRELYHEEEVHHIDGNKTNNSLDNLILFPSRSAHIKFHWSHKK